MALLLLVALSGSTFAANLSLTGDNSEKKLKWRDRSITFYISESILNSPAVDVPRERIDSLIRSSIEKWASEAGITVKFAYTKDTDVSGAKSGGDGVSIVTAAPTSTNILMFGSRASSVSALTRVFFGANGEITEADIVLNPTVRFGTDGSRGAFDLEGTLTHEAGHAFGLGHSRIFGATMHSHQGRNGTFNLPFSYSRSLSESDKYEIHARYADNDAAIDEGKLNFPKGKGASAGFVWLERAEDGAVVAAAPIGSDGAFEFSDVGPGEYFLSASGTAGGEKFLIRDEYFPTDSAKPLEFTVGAEDFGKSELKFGFNSQLAELAVPLEKNKLYSVYFAVPASVKGDVSLESGSPYIFIEKDSVSLQYSRSGIDVYSADVFVSPRVADGDYSLRVFADDNLIGIGCGVITIDSVANPWSKMIF